MDKIIWVGEMRTNSPGVVSLDSNVQEINWHVAAAVKLQYLCDRNTLQVYYSCNLSIFIMRTQKNNSYFTLYYMHFDNN